MPYLPSWVRNVGILYSIIENRMQSHLYVCFFCIYYFLFYLVQHQPSINAPSIILPNEEDPDTINILGLQQSPVEDDGAANDHDKSAHDSDDRNEPEVTSVVLNIYNAHIPNCGILSLLSYFVIIGKD